jgi:hypothetical protein
MTYGGNSKFEQRVLRNRDDDVIDHLPQMINDQWGFQRTAGGLMKLCGKHHLLLHKKLIDEKMYNPNCICMGE